MLSEKELKMYHSVGKQVRIIDSDGKAIIGKCVDFTPAYDNEPEESSLTLESPMVKAEKFPGLMELFEHEIQNITF